MVNAFKIHGTLCRVLSISELSRIRLRFQPIIDSGCHRRRRRTRHQREWIACFITIKTNYVEYVIEINHFTFVYIYVWLLTRWQMSTQQTTRSTRIHIQEQRIAAFNSIDFFQSCIQCVALSHTHIHSLGIHNGLWKFESQRSASASAALPPNDLCNKMNENRDKSEIGQFLPQLNTI